MTLEATHLDQARKVADAILYEGYLLYPYHQASQKNQSRFQFGVLMPVAYAEVDPSEPDASQTQCLVECDDAAEVRVSFRFLQLQHRQVARMMPSGKFLEVDSLDLDGTEVTTWDEAVEREEQVSVRVGELLTENFCVPFSCGPATTSSELTDSIGRLAGTVTRTLTAIYGVVTISATRVAGPFGALRLTVRVENVTDPGQRLRTRDDGLAYALIAAHCLIRVPGGSFISMTDPPQWAAAEVAACENIGTWPVLAGPAGCEDLMLSSPVILYDHAEVAPESSGDLFDATEIDEILTLRTLALTDEEKQAVRATDPRVTELMDRLEGMPPELFDRLHGAIRYLGAVPGQAGGGRAVGGQAGGGQAGGGQAEPGPVPMPAEDPSARVPWWDPGADTSVSPETDQVIVNGVPIARGSKVIMRPGSRRADAQDLFLVGRPATVQAVLFDIDSKVHVAVTPDDDPAADLHASHGRFLYFATDEIEPIESATNHETGQEDSA
jgi:hypothetical protein